MTAEQSSARSVKNALDSYGHTKWGFVIYRTSYTEGSETLWARFQAVLQQQARDMILASETPELLDGLEYRFVSDRERLADADVPTLRRIHAEWRSGPDAQAEQPDDASLVWPSDIPRYKHCVCADEESMRSVVDGVHPPEIDYDGKTFVKFLHCDWRDRSDDENDDEAAAREKESWMLLASWMLVTDAYDIFHDENVNWYTFWRLPPCVVNH